MKKKCFQVLNVKLEMTIFDIFDNDYLEYSFASEERDDQEITGSIEDSIMSGLLFLKRL